MPAVAFGQATWIDAVLERVCDQLATALPLPRDRVFESLYADDVHLQNPPADKFVAVGGLRFPVDQAGVAGGGRLNTGFNGSIRAAAFVRLASDQEFRDTRRLRDASRGALAFQHKLIDALQLFALTDAAGTTSLLREPMRIDSWEVQAKNPRDGSAWVVMPSVWQVKFTAALT